MKIDLHTHTKASDGQYSPCELVDIAYRENVRLLAITDHDTVDGIGEGAECARKRGIAFVPGIEISTNYLSLNEEIHILGYGIDVNDNRLVESTRIWKKERLNRGNLIKDYLEEKGVAIDLDIVKEYAGKGNLGRPHFAKYLVNMGIVKNREEAFNKYLDTNEFKLATTREKPTIESAIELIHNSGGKAVLAHPGIYNITQEEIDKLIIEMAYCGLDGVECIYSAHSLREIQHYIRLSREHNLLISSGSDFHGEKVKPNIRLGVDVNINNISLISECMNIFGIE